MRGVSVEKCYAILAALIQAETSRTESASMDVLEASSHRQAMAIRADVSTIIAWAD
jgi:hypothetical protein